MPEILLIGSTGMLGKDALAAFLGRHWNVRSPWHSDLDISLPQGIEALRRREWGTPDFIVNCAAYTAVDQAETDKMAAMRMNAVAPGALAYVAGEIGATLIHISTDFVFDGFATVPYSETDPANPLSIYGKSKLQGEQNILNEKCSALILRTSWLYGLGGKCFPQTILRRYLAKQPLRVVNDQRGCPTSTVDLAESICQCIETRLLPGIYHCTGNDEMTWFDFAGAVIDEYRTLNPEAPEPKIEPCSTSEFPTPARRPSYSVLSNQKIMAAGIPPHRPFTGSITEYVARFES